MYVVLVLITCHIFLLELWTFPFKRKKYNKLNKLVNEVTSLIKYSHVATSRLCANVS